jgi:hypothetical protein
VALAAIVVTVISPFYLDLPFDDIGAGLDVSPALNGCLRFTDLNGQDDTLDWQFVDDADVPPGPWRTIITTQGLTPEQR